VVTSPSRQLLSHFLPLLPLSPPCKPVFPLIEFSFPFLASCFKKFCASVNYLTSGRRKKVQATIGKLTPRKGMQMRAWMVGIAVVVAIGLIWSFAAMSNLVPVDGSGMSLAGISRPAE